MLIMRDVSRHGDLLVVLLYASTEYVLLGILSVEHSAIWFRLRCSLVIVPFRQVLSFSGYLHRLLFHTEGKTECTVAGQYL